MGTEVDVFITNFTLVDPEIYQLWVEGHTASEAVVVLNQRGLGQKTGASVELIASDVLDHYRSYSLIEKLLISPTRLQEQWAFQIRPQTYRMLISRYYSFDDNVVKELLGKKLSSKHRKDLDEVAEKTGVMLKSCRRQFDNIKRIYKTVEELPGSIKHNIQKHFYLPDDLTKQYACIVFMAVVRFEISKRRLQNVRFSTIKRCVDVIMESWTYPKTTAASNGEYFATEMDKEFLLDLRELRVLLDKEKEHKHFVCSSLRLQMLQKVYAELESHFRSYSRCIITLAMSLHRSRDLRNFFLELAQIVEPWKLSNWACQDVEHFLNAYTSSALEIFKEAEFRATWERYMVVVSKCLVFMYAN